MIQLPYEFGIPEENESLSTQEDLKSSKTPKQQVVESETSFDSGYFSPPISTRATQGYQRDSALLPVYHQSPIRVGLPSETRVLNNENSPSGFQFEDSGELATDLPAVLDDWDKNFIDNFQENLFGFDNIEDIGFIDAILKSSPLKSPYSSRFISPSKWKHCSPQKFQFSPVRVGQLSPLGNRHSNSTNKRWPSRQKFESVPGRSTSQPFCDKDSSSLRSPLKAVPSLFSENVFSQDLKLHIKEEPRYVTTNEPVSLFVPKNEYLEMDDPNTTAVRQSRVLKSVENYTHIVPRVGVSQNRPPSFGAPPSSMVSKTEPKRALVQNIEQHPICASKQKLQMARAHFKISLNRALQTASARHLASKSVQYPQLSKALTKKSAPAVGSSSQASSSESPESTVLPFERYKDCNSTAGSGYEVKRKSDCKVVIRKRSK